MKRKKGSIKYKTSYGIQTPSGSLEFWDDRADAEEVWEDALEYDAEARMDRAPKDIPGYNLVRIKVSTEILE